MDADVVQIGADRELGGPLGAEDQRFQRRRYPELVDAIRAAIRGETYVNPKLGARLAAEPVAEGPPDGLTPREVEVLNLLALGYMNPEIAEQLVLSVRTVETHRANIQRKTALSTRAELIAYALDHGLVDR